MEIQEIICFGACLTNTSSTIFIAKKKKQKNICFIKLLLVLFLMMEMDKEEIALSPDLRHSCLNSFLKWLHRNKKLTKNTPATFKVFRLSICLRCCVEKFLSVWLKDGNYNLGKRVFIYHLVYFMSSFTDR